MSPFTLRRWLVDAKKDVISHLVFDLWIGLTMLLDAPHRTSGASFAPARELFDHTSYYPIRAWGGIVLVLALCWLVSLATGNEFLYECCFWALRVYFGFWMGLFVIARINGDASGWSSGFAFFWFVRTCRLPIENPWVRVKPSVSQ